MPTHQTLFQCWDMCFAQNCSHRYICIVYQYRCQWASSSSILVILFNILSEISDWHKFIWGTDTSINQSKTAPWEEKTQVFTQFKITHLVIFEGLKV